MTQRLQKLLSIAVVAGLLAGCGRSIDLAIPVPTRTTAAKPAAVTPVAAPAAPTAPDAFEPTAQELAALEAASIDELLDDAPLEPGMSAAGLMPTPPPEDLGNFGALDDTLWRGARPTDAGLEKLLAKGLRTLVNFENDAKAVAHEKAWAEAHGVKFVSIPLSVITPPKREKIEQFLDLAMDPANRPLYFHCMQGRDRTGTAAFCYRVSHDHWGYDRAYQEMVSYQFHTYLLGLRSFLLYYARAPIAVKLPARTTAMTQGNSAVLHVSPEQTLAALKELINGATRSIYLEVFSLGNDSYGKQLFPLLKAKAKAGVEVKLLLDESGCRFLKGYDAMLAELRAAGIVVQIYATVHFVNADQIRSINITHRKLYLADGQRALVGGVNLHAPFDTTTQDLLIDWRGPVVSDLYAEFKHDWMLAGGTVLGQIANPGPATGSVTARVVVTSPGENRYEAREEILAAIDRARTNILIEQQYLWDDTLLDHLLSATKRGVKVRLMLPNGEQSLVQRMLNNASAAKLKDSGAEIRFYRGLTPEAHLHTKYFSIDDTWALTGSVNGDTRSLRDNQELDILTTDPTLIGQLKDRLFEADWSGHSSAFEVRPVSWLESKLYNLLESIDYYF